MPKEKRATTQRPIGEKRALVVWVGSWCSSGVRPFLVAPSGSLVPLACLLPCSCVCVLGPARFRLLSSRFIFTVSAPKVFQVSPVICWYAAIRVTHSRRPLRTDGTRRESAKLHLPPEGPIKCSLVSCIERLKPLLGGHISTPSYAQRRHRACSQCDDCREERISGRVRQGLTLSPWSWCSGVICRM